MNKMVEAAKVRIRYKTASQFLEFELMPWNFMLPEIQQLDELIYEA